MPVVTPLTIPLVNPTVATAVLLLVHVPVIAVFVSVVVKPVHKVNVPVITPAPDGEYKVAVPGTVLCPLGTVLPLCTVP